MSISSAHQVVLCAAFVAALALGVFWGAALLEQLGGTAVDGDLGLEFGDPTTRGDQLGVVDVGRPGQLPRVDELLARQV